MIKQKPCVVGERTEESLAMRAVVDGKSQRLSVNSAIGRLSELMVIQESVKRGFQPFEPTLHNAEIDLILLTPTGRFWRVQIKTGYKFYQQNRDGTKRGPYVSCGAKKSVKRGGKGLPYTQIDVFILVCDGRFFIIPKSAVPEKNSRLSVKWDSEWAEAWHILSPTDSL